MWPFGLINRTYLLGMSVSVQMCPSHPRWCLPRQLQTQQNNTSVLAHLPCYKYLPSIQSSPLTTSQNSSAEPAVILQQIISKANIRIHSNQAFFGQHFKVRAGSSLSAACPPAY
jgi:hypothetical protein